MSEYTPTEDDVRFGYTEERVESKRRAGVSETYTDAEAIFDRWLARVKAEAGAAALEAAANETISVAYSASTNGPAEYRDQPVLDAAVRKWLNARADVIRASAPEPRRNPMSTFDDDAFTSEADKVMLEEDGTESIREFIAAWFQWNIGDPTWADGLWEMLAMPLSERELIMDEWQ